MIIASIEYDNTTELPGQTCDAIYVPGTAFLIHPDWSPYPQLFSREYFNAIYNAYKTSPDVPRVITGGDPFRHGVELWTRLLKGAIDCPVILCTDGAYPYRIQAGYDLFDHIILRLWVPPSKYQSCDLLPAGIIDASIQAIRRYPSHEIRIMYDYDNTDLLTIYNEIKMFDIEYISVRVIHPLEPRVGKTIGQYKPEDAIGRAKATLPNDRRLVFLTSYNTACCSKKNFDIGRQDTDDHNPLKEDDI